MSRLVMVGTTRVKTPAPASRFTDDDVQRIWERDKGVCVLAQLVPEHVCAGRLPWNTSRTPLGWASAPPPTATMPS